MTRRQLSPRPPEVTAATLPAPGAVVIAVAASPLMPIGPARLAEPSPGISVNAGSSPIGFAASSCCCSPASR